MILFVCIHIFTDIEFNGETLDLTEKLSQTLWFICFDSSVFESRASEFLQINSSEVPKEKTDGFQSSFIVNGFLFWRSVQYSKGFAWVFCLFFFVCLNAVAMVTCGIVLMPVCSNVCKYSETVIVGERGGGKSDCGGEPVNTGRKEKSCALTSTATPAA